MPEPKEELPQRFPQLDKLGVAILEHLVESTIGQAAIDEVKKPYIQKQIADSLGEALTRVEAEFINSYRDKGVRDALLQLPVHDLEEIPAAIWAFYKRPSDRKFADILCRELKRVRGFSAEQVDSAVSYYLRLLKAEFVSVDPELQAKIQALATLDIAADINDMKGDVRGIRELLSERSKNATPETATHQRQETLVVPGSLPLGSYLPFTRNVLFTGREADLQYIDASLLSDHPSSTLISQAIQGMGGMGKTQLAVEFAFRYGYKFKGVHWLDLRDPATLDAQIAQCGALMQLQKWSDKQPEQVLMTVDAWKLDGPRLLILDNFEDVVVSAEVLACLQHPNLCLLITSRSTDWPASLGLHPLSLAVFTDEESIEFLRKYTKQRFADDQLKALAKRLGCLPLALELAGRYLEKHPHLAIEDYLAKLHTAFVHESMRGYRNDLPNATKHDLDLFGTFLLSWMQVQDPIAQKAFIIAGYCAPNTPIPPEIIEQALELDVVACDDVLSALQGLGLLSNGPAIHPLLAEFAQHLDTGKAILSTLAAKLAQVAEARNDEVDRTGDYSLYTPLLPHVRSVAERAESARLPEAAELWGSFAYHLRDLAAYASAKAAYERALNIDKAIFGTDHPKVEIVSNNLGAVLQDLGDLKGARAAFEQALHIAERIFGSDDPQVAIRANNLGAVLLDLGDLAGARAAIERALRIDEVAFGASHPRLATRLNNRSRVLQAEGNLLGARADLERALLIDEANFGSNHPRVGTALNSLGSVLRELGDVAGAKVALERGLRIDEAAFGPNHPKVARDLNSLARVLQADGDLVGAKADIERALAIDNAAFGPHHIKVAICLNTLGGILRDSGDLQGAHVALERAINIDEAAYGFDHPNVAIRLWQLGTVLQAQGDLASARVNYERALRTLKRFFPTGHSYITGVQTSLQSLPAQ